MDLSFIEWIASVGGIGAVFALLMFYVYRQTVKQMRDDRKYMQDEMRQVIDKDQETREEHTKVLTELVTLLKRINGRASS